MTEVTVNEAQRRLPELIAQLVPGEVISIIDNQENLATLTRARPNSKTPRRPGSAVGELVILEEDDDHLLDFREYME